MQVPSKPVLALAALAALALLGLYLLALRWTAAGSLPEASAEARGASSDAGISAPAPVEPIDERHAQGARTQLGKEAMPEAELQAVRATSGAPGIVLLVRFLSPNGMRLELDQGRAWLRDAQGEERSTPFAKCQEIRFEGLAPDEAHTLRIEAPGFEHRAQRIDLSFKGRIVREKKSGESVFSENSTLWPSDWVAIVVETTDGRPFAALADELGIHPARLFAGAFQARARLQPPDGRAAAADDSASLARFFPPPGYQSWELPGSCVGSLELLRPPPLWIELRLFDVPTSCELLLPGSTELVFRIDRTLLEGRLAHVRLRVVDAANGAPVEGALATLNADTSVHRRKDQGNVRSDRNGRVAFVLVVPGRYELRVLRGESQHQQMIDLGAGELRELGDIALSDAPGFDVLTVDAAGQPMSAYVEIGPFAAGRRSAELYPQMLRFRSDASGRARLPMPSQLAIVRATVEVGRSNHPASEQEVHGIRSANVLIDPSAARVRVLRLTLHEPFPVQLTWKGPDAAGIEVLDELDVVNAVVNARTSRPEKRTLNAELVPGRYRARARHADGSFGREVPFVLVDRPLGIDVD